MKDANVAMISINRGGSGAQVILESARGGQRGRRSRRLLTKGGNQFES